MHTYMSLAAGGKPSLPGGNERVGSTRRCFRFSEFVSPEILHRSPKTKTNSVAAGPRDLAGAGEVRLGQAEAVRLSGAGQR